jgi:hypothetical protein
MRRLVLASLLAIPAATPAAAQSLNVDVGSVLGVPASAYGGAAGQPGVWNQMSDGSGMQLVDLAGQPTSVIVSALGANFAFWSDNPGTTGDDEQLLDDACDGAATYTISGLAPGDYTVYTYAWAPDSASYLSTVDVPGSTDPAQTVGGSWPGAHALGVTYARHDVAAPTGQIVIDVSVASTYATSNGFQIVDNGGGGLSTFCTSKASSLPGCTSTLSGPSSAVSKGAGAGSYPMVASPAPGGSQPGIYLWSRTGLLGSPANTAFGFLCLSTFTRGTPALPGGTPGSCNGSYTWDLGGLVSSNAAIGVGDSLWVQCWYRDPGLSAGALLTQGIGPISVIP